MSYIHIEQAGDEPTMVLFHGTGGSERDLVEIGGNLLTGSRLLSPRGKVNENGMNRWFQRFGEGVFDEEDIRAQAADLALFLESKRDGPMIGLGYSNGANIGAALMLLQSEVLDALVMWRGMLPIQKPEFINLSGKSVLMINGLGDPMAPTASARQMAMHFREFGADVEHIELEGGHGLTQSDFLHTQRWLDELRQNLSGS